MLRQAALEAALKEAGVDPATVKVTAPAGSAGGPTRSRSSWARIAVSETEAPNL